MVNGYYSYFIYPFLNYNKNQLFCLEILVLIPILVFLALLDKDINFIFNVSIIIKFIKNNFKGKMKRTRNRYNINLFNTKRTDIFSNKNCIFSSEKIKAKNLEHKGRTKLQKNKFKNYWSKKNDEIGISIAKKNFKLITFIKPIILLLLVSKTKSNRFDIFYFGNINISLKIQGPGSNSIFGNKVGYSFEHINFTKEVYINHEKQDEISRAYNFNKTENLVELIIDDNIDNCYNMFRHCFSIIEINFINFNTSKVTSMNDMFCGLFLLKSLDLSGFDTSLVTSMYHMFNNCSSLTSLNLSNFNTSLVQYMQYMFYNCLSLSSLDLSNFNTSLTENMDRMFYNCAYLEYINLFNFEERKLNSYKEMFDKVPDNAVICLNKNPYQRNIRQQILSKECRVIDCSFDWKLKQKKMINGICYESCDTTKYKYEYNGKCVENCTQGFLYDNDNNRINKCKCELDKCLLCPQVALLNNLCTKCNSNYYQIESVPSNLGEYINCYQNPEGYYFDYEFSLYKKCFFTCKKCNIEGDYIIHNCIECKAPYFFEIKNKKFMNCYQNCSYYYYFDYENNYHCTTNLTCPEEFPKLIGNKMECMNSDIKNIIKDLLNNETDYDNILERIEKGFTSKNYDTSNIDNGKDEIFKTGKITITFTTSKNQVNNINNNVTRIDLGECEASLRNYYNISDDEELYIKKIDIEQDGLKTLKVEYEVYSKLLGQNLINLDLKVCEKKKILILIPIKLSGNIDKFNSSSGYFSDICYTTTSEDKTDISLKDRQKEFIDKGRIVCQENCHFSEYDHSNMIAKCSCQVKEFPISIADMNINKTKLLENFKNIKNIINVNFLVCYKKLFTKEGIINNIGSYLILLIIFIHIINAFVFCINQFKLIKNKINNIVFRIYELEPAKNTKQIKGDKPEKKQKNKFNDILIFKNDKKGHNNQRNRNKKLDSTNSKTHFNPKFIMNNKESIRKNKNNYIDEEINGLSYNQAKIHDKRTYFEYYTSLIKTQHNLFCILFNNDDYNSTAIKIDLFFLGFTIDYTLNGLFFNDDTMHKIYESKGDFDLEVQIPISIYSTLISMVLNWPLNFLALSNDPIIDFKQDSKKSNIIKRSKRLKKTLTIKFSFYFIISFLILSFFWYYISLFCVIYKNTQMHLLKDSLMSFVMSLFIPFVTYLFPGFFRIPALSNSKNKKECLYNFSKFLQSF